MKPVRPNGRLEARQRRRRGNAYAGIAIFLAAGALAAVVSAFLLLSQELSAKDRDISLLTEQVRALGGTPVAGPRGDTGAAGIVGPRGPSGAPGASGKAAPTLTPSPGPSGPVGPSGSPGVPGADSTVPGPAGQDATGAPGKDGSNGTNGSPPAEWTYTDPNTGVEYRCVPDDDFDPDHPSYHCEPTSTPTPTASSSQTQSGDPSPSPSDSPSPAGPPLVTLLRRPH